MTGCIIENMSSRKLTYVVLGLVSMQFLCFLLGAVVSPTPNSSMQYLATKCVDEKGGEDEDAWFYPRGGKGKCNPIQSLSDPANEAKGLGPDNIVFSVQMPHPREGKQLNFYRWQQNLIGVLSADIEYESGVEHDPRVSLLFKARLGYRNKGDPPGQWKEYASSVIHRNLDCEIDEDKKRDGYYYNCSIMPLFELGSLHHDYYLVNLRIPSAFDYEGHSVNVDSKIGRLVDLWLVGIHQTIERRFHQSVGWPQDRLFPRRPGRALLVLEQTEAPPTQHHPPGKDADVSGGIPLPSQLAPRVCNTHLRHAMASTFQRYQTGSFLCCPDGVLAGVFWGALDQ